MSPKFKFLIVSDQEREKVFCEIYYEDEILAEISQEKEKPEIALFSHPKKWWEFSLEEFLEVLEKAEKHLLGRS